MTTPDVFLGVAVALVVLGTVRLLLTTDLIRQVVALNVAGAGVLLLFVVVAARGRDEPDPVPHALTLTGIVVAVSVTAVALGLARRVEQAEQAEQDEQAVQDGERDGTTGAEPEP
jgi:multicomponent Na+:H+ antiporter subunit C